jgi:hypothetical protein
MAATQQRLADARCCENITTGSHGTNSNERRLQWLRFTEEPHNTASARRMAIPRDASGGKS